MKKLNFLSFVGCAIALAITISSCDFVTVPEQPGGVIFNGRKVLVEDFTGHKCPNCPKAAREAEKLGEKYNATAYGKIMIVVGIHANFFAKPVSPDYMEDFRTTAGTAYDTYFRLSSYPSGMINRKDYTTTNVTHLKSFSTWATEVQKELAKPKIADLVITNTYASKDSTVSCNIKSTFLSNPGGVYKLAVLITQDEIEAPQLDGTLHLDDYIHHHVLRTHITSDVWGDNLGAVKVNSAVTKTYNYPFPKAYPVGAAASMQTACDPNHCYVVAFIYDDLTKEIIQVEEAKVTQ
jgi:thiol-disulfide isomerase/thioredoxin